MNREEFYSVLKSVPKAEVHVHIEAVSTIETIKALYKKRFGKEMTDEDIKLQLEIDRTKNIRSIKNMVTFFVILIIIGIVVMFFGGVSLMDALR